MADYVPPLPPPVADSIASKWKKLSGEDNWEGLLHPLDKDLRRYVIHYGKMVGAIADLSSVKKNNESDTEEFKTNFFSNACLQKGNNFKYEVTDLIYAGSNTVKSAWFGYVAVATDEGMAALGRRDIFIGWRGTATSSEWQNNARTGPIETALFNKDKEVNPQPQPQVHDGFLSLYTATDPSSTFPVNRTISAQQQVLRALSNQIDECKKKPGDISITVAGFSLGAALAALTAMDIVANDFNGPYMVTAFTFGGPRIGNKHLNDAFKQLGNDLHLLRIKNKKDPVPLVPFEFKTYTDLEGQVLQVNTSISNWLKWARIGRTSDDVESTNTDQSPDVYPLIPNPPNIVRNPRGGFNVIYNIILNLMAAYVNDWLDYWFGRPEDYFSAHNMDVYLHGVAGVQENGMFEMVMDENNQLPLHDYALVNKYLNRLDESKGIPAYWWDAVNRNNMVQDNNGLWRPANTNPSIA